MYSVVLFIDNNNNNKMFLEQQINLIRIISEGSCDTEAWSNDAENLALNKYI